MVATGLENKSEDEIAKEKKKNLVWLWVFSILIILFGVGSIVFIVLSLQPVGDVPDEVCIVLYEYQINGVPVIERSSRHLAQIHAVQKYMSWISKIFVLSADKSGPDEVLKATFVPFTGTAEEAFQYMPSIPDITSHAIFFDDRTLPLREVKKAYFYSMKAPRMFNIFHEQSELDFFINYLELPTLPCLVTDLEKVKVSPDWRSLIFREISEEKIVLFNNMNVDVMIVGNLITNATNQFNIILKKPPLFITFHVNGNQSAENLTSANNIIANFLLTLMKD
jgi:hypothetical protein